MCEALVDCEFLPNGSDNAFEIKGVGANEPDNLLIDANGIERVVNIARGRIDASDDLLQVHASANRPLADDAELLTGKRIVGIGMRADAAVLPQTFRLTQVPSAKKRKEIITLVSDLLSREARRALLMDMVDLHMGDRFGLEQEILRSIGHVEPRWSSNDSAPSIFKRFERIRNKGGS